MAAYPSFTREQVLYRLPVCEGWAWYAWAVETDAWRETERKTPGYIRQEIDRRMSLKAKKQKPKPKPKR